ncbi:efflux transporter outer membrane subunit [Sphingomonas sp. So64.6b]|uniref:efflux transporter outer membrane subunit n=1 Tax=Sphingomonas sp. So64.6b TaxID=2997354 RepID=UPI001600C50B|nr:efflux transporter outer membrane subunit [Sphingomonas sp. So64.6b]QNA82833.1 efflux transporter outer membrane subunit [Sphingomonas sp. So64.6b]
MTRFALIPALASTLALSACAVGPNYERPATSTTAAGNFSEAARGGGVAATALPDDWWKLYDDPILDRLITDALAHNTDIRIAAANLARARAALSEQRGARLPSTDASASATRSRTAAGQSPTGQAFEIDYYSVGFDASYEIDLFGGVTRAIQAARGDADAAAAQLDAARVSIAAETARAYAAACSNAAQRAVAQETVGLQQQTLDLTNRLFDAGRGTRRDVERADVLLAQTQAQIPGFEAERRASLYALATLTGRPPAEIDGDADRCTTPPRVRAILPVGDGTTLLARRPDVRAAERTLAADTARVGVATADLYPSIRLLGSIGFGATKPGDVFKSSGFSYSLGPLISWNFPNQTQARARLRQAEATSDGSLARFDGTVLTALKEVEQALARYAGALDTNAALVRAERASGEAAKLSKLRFDYGADSFLLLIDAERDRASARAARAQSDAAVADAQISLFKALGGGWEDAPAVTRREP